MFVIPFRLFTLSLPAPSLSRGRRVSGRDLINRSVVYNYVKSYLSKINSKKYIIISRLLSPDRDGILLGFFK